MSDLYQGWRARLANAALPKAQQKKIPTYDGVVDVGFYRKRLTEKTEGGATKTVGYEPVAFWIEGEGDARELYGLQGSKSLNAGECEALWTWVCDKPISEAVYRAVAERKEPWPDQHTIKPAPPTKDERERAATPASATLEVVALEETALLPDMAPILEAQRARHAAAEADPAAPIIAEIEALKPGVADYKTIESDEQRDRAQDLKSQLTALAGKLDKHREVLVRPHVDAQAAINGRLNPIIKATRTLAADVNRANEVWEGVKRAAARMAEEDAARQARDAAEAGKPAPAPVQSNAPAPSEQIRGATGRAASVRTVYVAEITDQDALYQAVRTHPVIVEALQNIAQRRVDGGIETPGVTKREGVKIR